MVPARFNLYISHRKKKENDLNDCGTKSTDRKDNSKRK
ncbi:hypothetical protein T09_886 [Trichinella sp. T9]|nr:hypothetical protein T09_886 [Trichinella sp. T9]